VISIPRVELLCIEYGTDELVRVASSAFGLLSACRIELGIFTRFLIVERVLQPREVKIFIMAPYSRCSVLVVFQ
jgi:hypothetical protein